MDSPKSQERTDTRRRAGPRQMPPDSLTHLPERSPPPQLCGFSETPRPRQCRPRQPVDCSVHPEDSEPHCVDGAGCDCPRCRKNYGRHSRNGASPGPGGPDQGGLGRKRPGHHSPAPSQDPDQHPHSKKRASEGSHVDHPVPNPNDWVKEFLENCQQLGQEYEPLLRRARFYHQAKGWGKKNQDI